MVGKGGVSCNVASAEEIFVYQLYRCEVCVCEESLVVSAVVGHLRVIPCDE